MNQPANDNLPPDCFMVGYDPGHANDASCFTIMKREQSRMEVLYFFYGKEADFMNGMATGVSAESTEIIVALMEVIGNCSPLNAELGPQMMVTMERAVAFLGRIQQAGLMAKR